MANRSWLGIRGRICRLEFLLVLVLRVTLWFVVAAWTDSQLLQTEEYRHPGDLVFLFVILSLEVVYLLQVAKRLHDFGASAWWGALLLIPYVGLLVAIPVLLRRGDPGTNAYGPAPWSRTG